MKKVFGLLGGQGAIATARLHHKIVTYSAEQGAVQDEDFPALLITSLAAPVLDEYGNLSNEVSLRHFLAQNATAFQSAHQIIALCHTLHIHESILHQAFPNQLISLLDIVEKALTPFQHVYIAASNGSVAHNIFEQRHSSRNITYLNPETSSALILEGMRDRTGDQQITRNNLEYMINDFQASKAETLLLGCTDLSIYSQDLQQRGVPYIDPIELVAQYILKEAQ